MSAKKKSNHIVKLFRITFHQGSDEYLVIPLYLDPSVALKAFRLRKLTGNRNSYQVRFTPRRVQCQCKGFLRWGRCKHVRMLRAAGMLD
jgi:hypothetical protein